MCCFRDIQGQGFAILAPKIPFNVTYALNYDIMGLRLTGPTILPVKHISINLEVKGCV